MKFFVVLIILLNQAPIPKVYTYQFMTFNEIETCEVFIKTKRQKPVVMTQMWVGFVE